MIVITVLGLAFLAIMLILPNYIAIRYAMFGGNAQYAVATGSGSEAVGAPGAARSSKAPGRAGRFALGRGIQRFARRGYLWKALSPLLFGFALIIGIAIGGAVGYSVLGLAFLNLLWGLIGWDGYMAGKRPS